jgi:FkbM family methyltransferase
MLKNYFKSIVTKFVSFCGYELTHSQTLNDSEDPYTVLSRIIDTENVKVVVDGGASIGDISEKLSCLFPKSKIYTFEPYPPFLEKLYEKAKNNENIIVEPYALGRTTEKKLFNVNRSQGTNSLLEFREDAGKLYGTLTVQDETIEVNTKTLELWSKEKSIQTIDILKLDLQGGELDALNGGKKLFELGNIKVVLCEVMFSKCYEKQPNWTEIVYFLESFDLKLMNFYQPFFQHGQIIQADLIFVAKNTISETVLSDKFHSYSKLLKKRLL